LVLKITIQEKVIGGVTKKFDPQSLVVYQGTTPVKIENVFMEKRRLPSNDTIATGFILLRMDAFKKNQNLTLKFAPGEKQPALQIIFSPDFGSR